MLYYIYSKFLIGDIIFYVYIYLLYVYIRIYSKYILHSVLDECNERGSVQFPHINYPPHCFCLGLFLQFSLVPLL